jgi:hypothetical protein
MVFSHALSSSGTDSGSNRTRVLGDRLFNEVYAVLPGTSLRLLQLLFTICHDAAKSGKQQQQTSGAEESKEQHQEQATTTTTQPHYFAHCKFIHLFVSSSSKAVAAKQTKVDYKALVDAKTCITELARVLDDRLRVKLFVQNVSKFNRALNATAQLAAGPAAATASPPPTVRAAMVYELFLAKSLRGSFALSSSKDGGAVAQWFATYNGALCKLSVVKAADVLLAFVLEHGNDHHDDDGDFGSSFDTRLQVLEHGLSSLRARSDDDSNNSSGPVEARNAR